MNGFFYTVKPEYRKCTREELKEYIKNYPRKLEVDMYMGIVSYYDFSTAPYWPEALMVALYDIEYGESDWKICVNAEEVYNSKVPGHWAVYKDKAWYKTINGELI